MKYLYDDGSRTYTFNFRRARVRQNTEHSNGVKSRVMTKFEMGYTLEHGCSGNHHWYGLGVTLNENCYSYAEVKQRFLEALEQENFANVTVIK